MEQSVGGVPFCADEWLHALRLSLWDESARAKIEALQWTVAQRLLAVGKTVLIEWGTWSRSERDALRDGARALGARVELNYLAASLDVLYERIRQRGGMESLAITRDLIEKWVQQFQAPTAAEGALYDGYFSTTATTVGDPAG